MTRAQTTPFGETHDGRANGAARGTATAIPKGAAVAHHTRGRVRLKIAAAQQNPALLDEIKQAFGPVPGIDHIETRPASGSVVLYYDPEHHADVPGFFGNLAAATGDPEAAAAMRAAAERRPPPNRASEFSDQIEAEAAFLAEHSTFARAFVDLARQLDRELKRTTNNALDLKFLVPLGLAAVTFLEIGAAAATPMWVTLVIFSLNHFVELHAHTDARAAERA